MAARDWLDRFLHWGEREPARSISLFDYQSYFTFNGRPYPIAGQTTLGGKQEEPVPSFEGYVQGIYRSNGVVFACMEARRLLFSEARFQWRQRRDGRPGKLFGDRTLELLERPWPGATTGRLLSRAITDVDLAGNFFAIRIGNTIRRLRPDWVTMVLGSQMEPDDPGLALDADVIGYVYRPGGLYGHADPVVLLPEQVAHWAPIEDPLARYRGMSWLTPVIRDVMGDQAATQHKLQYFENGATVNLALSYPIETSKDLFDAYVKAFEDGHQGIANAYKTLHLGGGATPVPVGSTMEQLEFKVTQGAGETRIAAAARVPPIIVGLSEGLAAATYSNYGQARRAFADLTMRPLWRDLCGALERVVDPPADAELWYDDRDISFLQEDLQDAATIQQTQANAMQALVSAGYEPDSVQAAIIANDFGLLTHTGLFSVQLMPPGTEAPPAEASTNGASAEPIGANE